MINKTATWSGITLASAFLLKYFHAVSDTGDLRIILWPTSTMVGFFLSASPAYMDTGFYFPGLNILIDKSCSGVNFFIITFCVFSSTAPYHVLKTRASLMMFGAIILLAYGLTIAVNTSRIMGAVLMLKAEPFFPWITAPWVHEAEGALVYLSALLAAFLIVKTFFIKIKNQYAQPAQSSLAVSR